MGDPSPFKKKLSEILIWNSDENSNVSWPKEKLRDRHGNGV